MSWDVVFMKRTVSREALNSETDSPEPLGSADAVRSSLTEHLPGIRWTDPQWGTLASRELSFEFDLGAGPEVRDLSVHVRGSGDPFPALVKLACANSWSILDMSSCELLDLESPSRAGWNEFVAFRSQLGEALASRSRLELPRSGLAINSEALVRRVGPKVLEYRLAEISGLEFGRGANPAGVAIVAVAVAAAVAAKLLVPLAWLSWVITVVFALGAILFGLGAFGDHATFHVAGKSTRVWLVGYSPEILAFRSALRDAVERAGGRA